MDNIKNRSEAVKRGRFGIPCTISFGANMEVGYDGSQSWGSVSRTGPNCALECRCMLKPLLKHLVAFVKSGKSLFNRKWRQLYRFIESHVLKHGWHRVEDLRGF